MYGGRVCGKSLYLPLNFAVNLKSSKKKKALKKYFYYFKLKKLFYLLEYS